MMADFGWSYPPGVTGNEPELTGEWPCGACGGDGCYLCGGSGKHPEDPPVCRECGASDTEFFETLEAHAKLARPGRYEPNHARLVLRLAVALEERQHGNLLIDCTSQTVCFTCGNVERG